MDRIVKQGNVEFGWKFQSQFVLAFAILCIIIVFIYKEALLDLVRAWNGKEEYGYAYFLPLLSIYLIWQRKNELILSKYQPSWLGVILLILSSFLYILGQLATTYTLVQYSFIFAVMAIAYAIVGRRSYKIIVMPLLLLFFAVPLPQFIYNNISGELQLISSEIGVEIIRWFGISVYLEGNVIDLGDYKLQVVEACNGLRYLFPLVSLSFLAAYFYRVDYWKRIVVFLSSIPITVFMNSFRIGVIGVLVNNWGQDQADGFLHYFEGWIVFIACLLILVIEMTLLAKIGSPNLKLKNVFGIEVQKALPEGLTYNIRPITSVHYAILVSVILIAVCSYYITEQKNYLPDRQQFSSFPLKIGNWEGDEDILEEKYLRSLKLDDYIIGDYSNLSGSIVNFYTAYYSSQQAGSAAHSPRSCIPGGGWEIDEVKQVDVPELYVNGEQLKVNRLVIMRGESKKLVYYWFQQRGRIMTNEWLVKWYLFLDGLTKHRTDGALVRLTTNINNGEEWEDGDKRLVDFAGEMVPLLDVYIPN